MPNEGYIKLNDINIFYSIHQCSSKTMLNSPTILVLHGGPGIDHTLYVPFWSQLSNIANIVFIDHRGNGRSDKSSSDKWNLQQWGKDIHEICAKMDIKKPIIAGISFGGHVALSYTLQFPKEPSGLILCDTEAKFSKKRVIEAFLRKGGSTIAEIARAQLENPSDTTFSLYLEKCVPLCSNKPYTMDALNRCIQRPEVDEHYANNELATHNFLDKLHTIVCPVLLLAATESPVHPFENYLEMKRKLTSCSVETHKFEGGSPVYNEHPDSVKEAIKTFLLKTH